MRTVGLVPWTKIIMVVTIVATARLAAVAAADPISDLFAVTPLVSMFYLPTGVVSISLLVFGYWAAIGVALNGVVWTILHPGLGFADSVLLAAARWTACVLTLGVFTVVCQKWFDHECKALTTRSALIFVALLSVANAAVHHLTFRRRQACFSKGRNLLRHDDWRRSWSPRDSPPLQSGDIRSDLGAANRRLRTTNSPTSSGSQK